VTPKVAVVRQACVLSTHTPHPWGGKEGGEKVTKRATLKLADLLPQGRATTASPEQIKDLALDIQVHGLKHPIIVYDGQVLDGLARIEAFKSLGMEQIAAIVSNRFDELCLALAKSRSKPMDYPRAVALIELLSGPRHEFVSERRKETGSTKKPAKGPAEGMQVRDLYVAATGMPPGRTELAQRLIARAATDPGSAKKLEEVKAGTVTLYGWKRWLDRGIEEPVPEAPTDEVRAVMERGLRTLAMTIETMAKFGPASQLTLAERQKIMDVLGARKVALRNLGKKIR